MRQSGKHGRNGAPRVGEAKAELENEVDALFRLSLAEFTGARNALATRLKKSGRGDDAALVKGLAKPSVSAWAVNQLYWNHQEAFDRLVASGERFHKSQTSGKIADMRTALDARREVLTELSDLATSVLRDAAHNPSPDTILRITTTLEAMSVYATRSDAPRPGRLTHDVDPPGFESLGSFVPPAAGITKEPPRPTPSQKSSSLVTNTRGKVATDHDVRKLEETRKRKIAAARVSLQDAKKALTEARARAHGLGPAQKKAYAEAKKADKRRRDAEEELRKAKAASEDAARNARTLSVEVEEAVTAVNDAERAIEKASKELEAVFQESPGR